MGVEFAWIAIINESNNYGGSSNILVLGFISVALRYDIWERLFRLLAGYYEACSNLAWLCVYPMFFNWRFLGFCSALLLGLFASSSQDQACLNVIIAVDVFKRTQLLLVWLLAILLSLKNHDLC